MDVALKARGPSRRSFAEGVQGEPIWDVVTKYLRDVKTVKPVKLNLPKLVGVEGNAGIA